MRTAADGIGGALLVGVAWAAVAYAQTHSLAAPLTLEQARRLVYAATDSRLTGVALEADHSVYEPDFIVLVAIDPNPVHRADMATYAVNVATGEVWSTAGRCTRISSARLRALLQELQSRPGIDQQAAKEQRAKKPNLCGSG